MSEDLRRVKGCKTRERIISATIELIADGGLKEVSVSKISSYIKTSKSSVFHHFSSVDDIYDAAFGKLCSGLSFEADSRKFADLESFFEHIGKGAISENREDLVCGRALIAFYNEAVYREKFVSEIGELKKNFSYYLKKSVLDISGKILTGEQAEMITIDLDGIGLHFLIEKDYERYRKLWAMKTKMYISLIEQEGAET